MMIIRPVLLASLLLIGISCSSVREPKERLVRSSGSYESDLRGLQRYIAKSPVDIVVAGYHPDSIAEIPVEFSPDSLEITIKQAVILQIDPVTTVLRPKGWSATRYTRVPTDNLVRISAEGLRPPEDSGSDVIWFIPILTGVFALSVGIMFKRLFDMYGIGALVYVILGVVATLLCVSSTIAILLSRKPVSYEALKGASKTWTFQ